MELDSIEGLNEIRQSIYRVAMKLLALQRLCHMDMVYIRHITAALHLQQEVELNRQRVTQTMNRMFHCVLQEIPGHVTAEAQEETCSLMFRLNDRSQSGFISAASLQTSLIALSAESLMLKYTALVQVAEDSSGSVSRSGLRSLLQDLCQLPAAVQEDGMFSDVEVAVTSCFYGVLTPTVSKAHVLSWLQSEPHLLLWLPTLYRLSVGQKVRHTVRCHICKTRPIIGLRYRCMKCVNVHLCQSCFLTDRHTRKHTTQHPVLEFCTQPTWKESLTMLMHCAHNALLPHQYTQRGADRRQVLMWVEPGETQHSALPPSGAPTRLAASAVSHSPSSDREVSQDSSVLPPSCSFLSKALQADKDKETHQASNLLTEVRNLQRDKWLMEQQLHVWRVTVQSEQGILEDRCSDMEVTMKTLREYNLQLQCKLTQALNRMEAQQPVNRTPADVASESTEDMSVENTEDIKNSENMGTDLMPSLNSERNTEKDNVLLKMENEWSEEELQLPSPTMHQDISLSYIIHSDKGKEGSAGRWFHCGQTEEQDGPVVMVQQKDNCVSEEKDCRMCSLEQLLQETVERLRTVMERGQTCEKKRVELLQAADHVGDSIHQLVDAVTTNTH